MKSLRNVLIEASTVLVIVLLAACTSLPDDVAVVGDFELERYLGTWYEIARLDHRFERGLSSVTATYSMRGDGGVNVLNRGYKASADEWDEASGKAYFVDEPDVGRLKVSFFGPFYGGYNIVELDKDRYRYALVAGPNRNYLWILSRAPTLDDGILTALVSTATRLGFPTDELIYVDH